MPFADADAERIVQLLLKDVAATVGGGYAVIVRSRADQVLDSAMDLDDDLSSSTQRLVDDVQGQFHDCFIDTTWPRCPHHGRHPLWFHERRWWCDQDRVSIADLGAVTRTGSGPRT